MLRNDMKVSTKKPEVMPEVVEKVFKPKYDLSGLW